MAELGRPAGLMPCQDHGDVGVISNGCWVAGMGGGLVQAGWPNMAAQNQLLGSNISQSSRYFEQSLLLYICSATIWT